MGAYKLSQKAAADVEDIYTYTIEQHGVVLARKYVNGLHACFEHARAGCIRRPFGYTLRAEAGGDRAPIPGAHRGACEESRG